MKLKRNNLARLVHRAKNTTYKNPNGCWVWTKGRQGDGYPTTTIDGKHVLVHRVMFEITYGIIPEGYVIHHKCSNRCCVNPQHLECMSAEAHTRLQRGTKRHEF